MADVSHYLICYHFDPEPSPDPDLSRLLVAKRIVAPDGPTAEPLPTQYTVDVTCTTPDGDTITDTFTFDSGGGIGTTSDGSRLMNDIPVGSVCTTVEQTGTLPDGTVVSYLPDTAPDPGVTIEEGTVTIVRVVNDFTDVDGATGDLTITKAVDDPSGRADGMSFTIDAACQGPVVERVDLADGETTEVGPVQADSYCIVREETGDLPDDWEVTYLVDGEEPTATAPGGAPVFPVTADTTVEVTVTNVVPPCPNGQMPDPENPTVCIPIPPVLELEKTSTATEVTPGEEVPYDITVTNTSESDATEVVVTDQLPTGLTFVSSTPACTADGQTVTCQIGDLAAGENATIAMVTEAADPFPPEGVDPDGNVINTATVTSPGTNCEAGSDDPDCTGNVPLPLVPIEPTPECPDGQMPDPDDPTACVPVPTNGLAKTGNVGWALPAVGMGLLGGGGLLMLAANRRRTAH